MDILNQFGVQPVLLAAQVVNFFILLFILKRFLYKPILKVLEQRKQRIEESLKNAEEIEKRLQQTIEEEERRLQKASLESEKIVRSTEAAAAQIIDESRAKAKELSQRILKEGQMQLQLEKEKLQQEVRADLADILALALQKVTGKMFNKKDQRELIEQTVKHLRA